jgi:hypothetical protein
MASRLARSDLVLDASTRAGAGDAKLGRIPAHCVLYYMGEACCGYRRRLVLGALRRSLQGLAIRSIYS